MQRKVPATGQLEKKPRSAQHCPRCLGFLSLPPIVFQWEGVLLDVLCRFCSNRKWSFLLAIWEINIAMDWDSWIPGPILPLTWQVSLSKPLDFSEYQWILWHKSRCPPAIGNIGAWQLSAEKPLEFVFGRKSHLIQSLFFLPEMAYVQ